MVGWIWWSLLNAWHKPEGIRGDPGDEGVLHLPVWEALQSFLQSCFHQTLRKFLRVHSSPRPIDILDNVQLFDKPVAHRDICAADPRSEWSNIDNGPWLQGTHEVMKGLQKLQQAVAGHNIRKCRDNLAAFACISVHNGMHSAIDSFFLDDDSLDWFLTWGVIFLLWIHDIHDDIIGNLAHLLDLLFLWVYYLGQYLHQNCQAHLRLICISYLKYLSSYAIFIFLQGGRRVIFGPWPIN